MTAEKKAIQPNWRGTRVVSVALMAMLVAACGREPATDPAPPQVRRLTQSQYRNIIADVFGTSIKIPGRFEPELRANGLVAVGSGIATITPAGFEQYEQMSRSIAAQVVSSEHRERLLPCQPNDAKAPDDECAREVLAKYGRLLFRRALTEEELTSRVEIAHDTAKRLEDFYAGLELALSSVLVSPSFLFRREAVEPDPDEPKRYRLDGYSKASRLSFFLWNTAPDDELLSAAERGELHDKKGLERQVERLLQSPRYQAGVRAFFTDMLALDDMHGLAKDPVIYPAFTNVVAEHAREQTLLTILDLLVTRNEDYRKLFTTRKTFMSRSLGSIYQVPVRAESGYEPYEFAADDPRAGLLTQISFLAQHSHPGRSSATLRGQAVRKLFLCQEVPAAPANVNFTVVQETDNPDYKTARDRLTAHRTDPACTGCHEFIDPIGLALENFDGAGRFRRAENGVPIDASGTIDGIPFQDSIGLGQALHDLPLTTSCLVDRMFAYGVGYAPRSGDHEWRDYLKNKFREDGYRVPQLMRRIALSDAFYAVTFSKGGRDVSIASRSIEQENRS